MGRPAIAVKAVALEKRGGKTTPFRSCFENMSKITTGEKNGSGFEVKLDYGKLGPHLFTKICEKNGRKLLKRDRFR